MPSNTDFHQWLLQSPQGMKPALRRELKRQADLLVAEMRSRTHDATGALDQSIRVEDGKDELTFVIKAGGPITTKQSPAGSYDYALGHEFGNTRSPAMPFFWPSYRARKEPIRKAINDVILSYFEGPTSGGFAARLSRTKT